MDDVQREPISVEKIGATDLSTLRKLLPEWLSSHLSEKDDLRARTHVLLEQRVASVGDDDLLALQAAYRCCGAEYRFYPVSLPGRTLGHVFLSQIPTRSRVVGSANLHAALARGPTLLVSNHLSYADSQLTEYLTARHGDDDLARRLAFIAGPKVYQDPFRRMAAASLNTIPTVQSSRLSHNTAGYSLREVARIARETIRSTFELMHDGFAVVLYAEGSRSRSGRLGSFLKATCRYAQLEGLRIVPVALTGTEQVFPVHEHRLRSAALVVRFGEPLLADHHNAAESMGQAWHALAALLAPSQRPDAGTAPLT